MLREILAGTKVHVARGRFRKSHNEKFIVHLLLRGICSKVGRDKMLRAYKTFVWKSEGNRSLGRPTCEYGFLRNTMLGVDWNLSASQEGLCSMLLFSYFLKFVMQDFFYVFRKMKSVPAVTITSRACFSGEILVKAWYGRINRIQQESARKGLLLKDRLICYVSLYL